MWKAEKSGLKYVSIKCENHKKGFAVQLDVVPAKTGPINRNGNVPFNGNASFNGDGNAGPPNGNGNVQSPNASGNDNAIVRSI